MIIDAGQNKIGSEQCGTCSFFYSPGDADEERLHGQHHKRAAGIIAFAHRWKNERLARLEEVADFRIIVVKPGDDRRHWKTAKDVLAVVDEALGVDQSAVVRNERMPEVYLAIQDKRVAGCLLAEDIHGPDRLQRSFVGDGVRVLSDYLKPTTKGQLTGVSRLWVHADFQRRGMATKLMDAVREHRVK